MSNPLTPAVLSQWFSSSVFTLDYWDYGEWLLEDSLMLVSYVELVENRKHVWKFDSLSLVLSLAVFICDSLLLLWVMGRELKAPCSGPPVCECFVRISLIKLCFRICVWLPAAGAVTSVKGNHSSTLPWIRFGGNTYGLSVICWCIFGLWLWNSSPTEAPKQGSST